MKKLSILLILMALALSLAACAEEPAPQESNESKGSTETTVTAEPIETTVPIETTGPEVPPTESVSLSSPPSSYNDTFVWNDDADDILGTWEFSYYEIQTAEGTSYTNTFTSSEPQKLAAKVHFEPDRTGYVIDTNGRMYYITWHRYRENYMSERGEIAVQSADGSWMFYYSTDSTDTNYRTLSNIVYGSSDVVYYYLHKTESIAASDKITDEDVIIDGDNYILGTYTFQRTTLTVDGQTFSGWMLVSCSDAFDEEIIPATLLGEPVIAIGPEAFYKQEFVTSIQLPDTIISIGDNAFALCLSLKTINIPDGVRQIGDSAFYGSYSIQELILPDSVTSLGKHAFINCSGLQTLRLSSNLTELEDEMLSFVYLEFLEVPEGITKVGDACFRTVTLRRIILPSTLTELGDNIMQSLVEAVFFRGTAEQCPQALLDQLQELNVPIYYLSETEPADEGNYWHYVDGQPVIYGAEETPSEEENPAESIEDNYKVVRYGRKVYRVGPCDYRQITLLIDGQEFFGMALTDCNQPVESLVIPEEVNGLPVIAIDCDFSTVLWMMSFNAGISNFVLVDMPDTILYIGDNTFDQCTGLEYVNLSSNLKWVGDYAFNKCTNLTQLALPTGIEWIGDYCFFQCANLTKMNLPTSVKWIGYDAFYNCPGLTTLRITKDLQLNYGSLYGAVNLTAVILEAGVTEIPVEIPDTVTTLQLSPDMTELPAEMLAGTQVTFLEVYEGVTKLGDSCFANETLEQIILPSTLTEIGSDLFAVSLTSKSESFEAPVRQVFFRGTAEQCPQELLDYLKEVCVPIYYLSETEPTEEGNFWHYVDGKPVIW